MDAPMVSIDKEMDKQMKHMKKRNMFQGNRLKQKIEN